MQIVFTYPVRLVSESNQREHWAKRAARVKAHRIMAWAEMKRAITGQFLGPVRVKLTRIAPRPLDKHDNLRSSLKATVDGIADFFGVRDDDPRLEFEYSQERGAPKYYAVRIEVAARESLQPEEAWPVTK